MRIQEKRRKESGSAAAGHTLITDIQLASKLGISKSSVWNHVNSGILPKPIKISKHSRWLEAEIDDLIEAYLAKRDAV